VRQVGLVLGIPLSRGVNPLACMDKDRVLYKNAGGVSIGVQSLLSVRLNFEH